jgi:Flp pilus assembly protein TadG
MKQRSKLHNLLSDIKGDNSGLALVEFAVSLPFFMGLVIGGFETSNYAYTVMRLNQLTINTSDSAARMGEGDKLSAKTITEQQINDVFAGTIREGERILLGGQHIYTDPSSGDVTLRGNARIILTSYEPVASFDPANPRYRIRWQRCVGLANFYSSNYGTKDTVTNATGGIGPTGRQIKPTQDSPIMFVETQYYFKPEILTGFAKIGEGTIRQTAAMIVRDRRELNPTEPGNANAYPEGIKNPTNVNVSNCT